MTLNDVEHGSSAAVARKDWAAHLDPTQELASDADEQLLMHVRPGDARRGEREYTSRPKVVNGASYVAVDAILDKAYPGHRINANVDAAEPLRPAPWTDLGAIEESMNEIMYTEAAKVREYDSGAVLAQNDTARALKTVGGIWGGDNVEHYQWADRGGHYCNKVRAAARKVRDWDEAVLNLNRIIHRRAGQIGRLRVRESVNPIDCGDLIHLKAWTHKGRYVAKDDKKGIALPFRKLAVTDIPAGFGFDKFGLMPKHAKAATHRERSDGDRREELAGSLRSLNEKFAKKERLSRGQTWSTPIPHDRKVTTVQEFYKAFHDMSTLLIQTCMVCYRKCAKVELETIE
ncbi:hypothetical protein GGTG_13278 [Gaeumannomyces tritici R3-111a-1]|uniref:Uncharacterized protein n=1 Tax=Gaeumannomyces tritici (strain R3-111a-1) TaxID=644352 RepID=J3PIF0_GAET3|nr:hypothetical protein GGTG_13278 [Gaeumannomyces tritici R3-111a-1]EJT69169.1 hypothetical protein GGTG_13278 [Gaeumannomyces tritici R3-111a-1]